MTLAQTTYQRLRPLVSPGLRTRARSVVELFFDVGLKRSYSQFGEDAVVRAYFQTKEWQENEQEFAPFQSPKLRKGYFVDVGAYAPKQHSNTYAFYKLGWNGINIDATPGSMKSFDLSRKRDTNIEAVISDREEEVTLYCWGVPHLTNTVSRQMADLWTEESGTAPQELTVKTVRLDTILSEHLPPNQPISFLSIDAEGHDLEVLRSNDWTRYRPELVVVEQLIEKVHDLLESESTSFMNEVGYEPYAWVAPSVIYKAREKSGGWTGFM